MDFFSSDAFLEALARARLPGRRATPAIVQIGDARFRLLKYGRGKFIARVPFLDFHTPVVEGSDSAPERLPFLRRAEQGVISSERWEEARRERPWMVSPLIDWSSFPDWGSVERHVKSSRRKLLSDTERSRRKLEQLAGPVEIMLEREPADHLLEHCFSWKAEQCRETGLPNPFADERNTSLFRKLASSGHLSVSVLLAGGSPVAVHLGAVYEGRFLYWVPAYDRRFRQCAPGRILLHRLLEDSFAKGHRSFEFLIGDEPYKFHYASHARLVGPVGRQPLSEQAYQEARAKTASLIRRVPALHRAARAAKHRDLGELTPKAPRG